jgi:hypothetical protein
VYQCAACGLLSLRGETCHGCGGRAMLDLESEEALVPEGMADVPGLDEAVVVLEDIAPFEVTSEANDEDTADSDLPFGFGGHAREYISSLPFGIGASRAGLAHLMEAEEGDAPISASTVDIPEAAVDDDAAPHPPASHRVEAASRPPVHHNAEMDLDEEQGLDLDAKVVQEHEADEAEASSATSSLAEVQAPDLWMSPVDSVRAAYGLGHVSQAPPAVPDETEAPPLTSPAVKGVERPSWPPFSLMAPSEGLLTGPGHAELIRFFQSVANAEWEVALEVGGLLAQKGSMDASMLTAFGVAHLERAESTNDAEGYARGCELLKEAAKKSGGTVQAMANLAVALAMSGLLEPLAKVVASLSNQADVDGHVARARQASQIAHDYAL